MDTILIQVTNKKALKLLRDMEELDLIKVIKESTGTTKLSEKYRNVFTREDAKNFDDHTQQTRKEWDNT